MFYRAAWFCMLIWGLANAGVFGNAAPESPQGVVIGVPPGASRLELLAAREIHRYLYLRTGERVPIVTGDALTDSLTGAIYVGLKDRFEVRNDPAAAREIADLKPQEFLLRWEHTDQGRMLYVIGGDGPGTLYGAYRLAEHLGVRFYLHGDVIPDERIPLQVPALNETGRPLFELRGIQPFHDFPEGPDWWNLDDYKAILGQLPKLRMNFFGLHTYPEERPNAEPTVWIGSPGDFDETGQVSFSYPSSYMNTRRGNWGYLPKLISEYALGADLLFHDIVYGPEVMGGSIPAPVEEDECDAVFNRTAAMLREAFVFARGLGIKTCVGTETPLIVPARVKERLQSFGKNPASPEVTRELYEGMFQHIMRAYPVDYYWLWTPEGWIWEGAGAEEINATQTDLSAAVDAAKKVQAPFTLATCGWVLGPQTDRALFHRILPPEMPISCINREVGKAPLQPDFARLKNRPAWAIPWLEDDPALLQPQLWVGRMRADAVDAKAYGCTGLMGIHWRTRILGPNVSALAWAAWDQQDWYDPATDLSLIPETEGVVGGQWIANPTAEIAKTEDDELYRTVRSAVRSYHIAVPKGKYTVTLQFCAQESSLFAVAIEGKSVLEKLDITTAAGANTALDYTFMDISVDDGRLDIEFSPMIHNPSIAALVIQSDSFTKKINCGGEAYKDYQADWPASKPKPRHLPAGDFYQDWARSQFGPAAAREIAAIFTALDGNLPRPSDWVDGPGGIKPDPRPWETVQREYEFVGKLESLRGKIQGQGNRARFDYWLNQFRFLRSIAKGNCEWAALNQAIQKAKNEPVATKRQALARRELLPIRLQLIQTVREAYTALLATVSNTGEMGTVMNLEQHIFPLLLDNTAQEIEAVMGEALPENARLPKGYKGPARLIVPTVRSSIEAGERLTLKVIVLDSRKPREAALLWREMGIGEFSPIPLTHMGQGVYLVDLPNDASRRDFVEYYIRVRTAGGTVLYYPDTAPETNQTLVVMPKG